MDIWKWVHGRCDDLSENGHDELVDYIDRISTYAVNDEFDNCLLYTSPSPRDATLSRMPSSA